MAAVLKCRDVIEAFGQRMELWLSPASNSGNGACSLSTSASGSDTISHPAGMAAECMPPPVVPLLAPPPRCSLPPLPPIQTSSPLARGSSGLPLLPGTWRSGPGTPAQLRGSAAVAAVRMGARVPLGSTTAMEPPTTPGAVRVELDRLPTLDDSPADGAAPQLPVSSSAGGDGGAADIDDDANANGCNDGERVGGGEPHPWRAAAVAGARFASFRAWHSGTGTTGGSEQQTQPPQQQQQ